MPLILDNREVNSVTETATKTPLVTIPYTDGSEQLTQLLAQALCLATEADLVLIGFTGADGIFREQARAYSPAGADADWSRWPELATALSRNDTRSQGNCEESALQTRAWPGPLLVVQQTDAVGRTYSVGLFRLPGQTQFDEREHQIAQALAPLLSHTHPGEEMHLLVQVRLLTQIAQIGGSSPDLTYILRFALRELARHCPGCLASIWLLDSKVPPRLSLAVCSDLGNRRNSSLGGTSNPNVQPAFLANHFLVNQTPLMPVLAQRQVVYLPSLAGQPCELLRHWSGHGFQAGAAVPLFVGQETVGLLLLLSQRPAGLTKNELDMAATVGELLGPLIACHRLNQQLNRAYEQLQKAQQQLVNAEKMRALGELASGMAHDFNNALCGTLGFIELALKDPHLPPSVRELLAMARTCALDAATTVRRVQDFARWDRNLQNAELVQVNDVARQAVELTKPRWYNAARAGSCVIDVQLDLQAQAPVMANPSELREVLTNLIFNAIDAMPQGGIIRIATANDSEHVFLQVSDTGIGMSPEILQRLFEPFFTTKKERGTGLGLSVSYAIVKRHGGEIQVSSEPGRGSTFTVKLPIVRPVQASSVGVGSVPAQEPPKSLRVLVVDDEPHVLSFLRQCLLHLGHQPDTESDPEQALEQFRRARYDLVITDLGMPKLDGKQLAAHIHQWAPHVPVVMLTGWGEQIRPGEDWPQGVRHVLTKPITVEQLAQVLRSPMSHNAEV